MERQTDVIRLEFLSTVRILGIELSEQTAEQQRTYPQKKEIARFQIQIIAKIFLFFVWLFFFLCLLTTAAFWFHSIDVNMCAFCSAAECRTATTVKKIAELNRETYYQNNQNNFIMRYMIHVTDHVSYRHKS